MNIFSLSKPMTALLIAAALTLPLRAQQSAVPDPSADQPLPAPTPISLAEVDQMVSNLSPRAESSGLRDTGNGETTSSARSSDAAPSAPAPSSASSASPNAMVNLVNLLVSQHVITKEAGDGLIKQAEQEADAVRAQQASTEAAADRALAVQSAPVPTPTPAPVENSEDEVKVNYVPDVVKNQIRDEVTQDVLKQTRDEDFVAKDDIPDWVKHLRITGDLRVRYEGDFYPDSNAVGSFTNFNAINTGSGFVLGTLNPPQYNVDQDRNRFRFRARFGGEMDLGQNFTLGLRVGTGSDDSPVTENQTIGGANSAQGGYFAKYAIWLDRAFLKYEFSADALSAAFTVGRFDNPFLHTSMIWADDLAFDGLLAQVRYKVNDALTPFLVAGAFPVFNTDFNFSSDQSAKFSSEDKYLFAAQAGANWAINKDFNFKGAVAMYYFDNIEGKVSDPIPVASTADVGNTDDSRPSFAQNGNTYIALRDFTDPAPPAGSEIQYYGLATPFHDLAVTGQLDYSGFDPFHMWLTGEFVENLAFDRNAIINGGPASSPGPVNNFNGGDPTDFAGGNLGWMIKLNAGKVDLEQLWDWNVALSYRYVQSDATVDAFTDSDFGTPLTGTNLKGYTLGGNLALSQRVWLGLRWMSADAIAGPTFKNDLVQFDINAKF
ncbi:MAG: putative porin [Methylacidiphilales bacterium]|nr:putative porin [Candidatus Methylacidiphilales bacterium]